MERTAQAWLAAGSHFEWVPTEPMRHARTLNIFHAEFGDPEAPVLVWDGREPLVNLIRLERVREHHRIYYQQNKGS